MCHILMTWASVEGMKFFVHPLFSPVLPMHHVHSSCSENDWKNSATLVISTSKFCISKSMPKYSCFVKSTYLGYKQRLGNSKKKLLYLQQNSKIGQRHSCSLQAQSKFGFGLSRISSISSINCLQLKLFNNLNKSCQHGERIE